MLITNLKIVNFFNTSTARSLLFNYMRKLHPFLLKKSSILWSEDFIEIVSTLKSSINCSQELVPALTNGIAGSKLKLLSSKILFAAAAVKKRTTSPYGRT